MKWSFTTSDMAPDGGRGKGSDLESIWEEQVAAAFNERPSDCCITEGPPHLAVLGPTQVRNLLSFPQDHFRRATLALAASPLTSGVITHRFEPTLVPAGCPQGSR
jgi:hypothetical protein